MLLVAIPKSASTSLVYTIAEMTGTIPMPYQNRKKHDVMCEGYSEIQKYHRNMAERSDIYIEQVVLGRKKIFREHILPTDRHLRLLGKQKENILVLLRNPAHVYNAYVRLKKNNKNMNLEQIKKDVINIHDRYMYWASNKRNVLVVYYRDLVLTEKSTINRIISHFNLKKKKDIKLKKLKYTGIGVARLNDTNSTT